MFLDVVCLEGCYVFLMVFGFLLGLVLAWFAFLFQKISKKIFYVEDTMIHMLQTVSVLLCISPVRTSTEYMKCEDVSYKLNLKMTPSHRKPQKFL